MGGGWGRSDGEVRREVVRPRGGAWGGLVLVRAGIRFLPKMSPTLCHLFQEHKATFIAGGR